MKYIDHLFYAYMHNCNIFCLLSIPAKNMLLDLSLFSSPYNIHIYLIVYKFVKGTVLSKQFFDVFSENLLSNQKFYKGLIAFSAPLASSFNWGAPCKSEVTTMGFIFKIGVFSRRKTINEYYFCQSFLFLSGFIQQARCPGYSRF